MTWDKLKEMNLYDKVEDHLKSISENDSEAVESIITDTEKLQLFKYYMHKGLDTTMIGHSMGISKRQADVIKDMIGKL